MKRSSLFASLVLAGSLGFTACDSDEADKTPDTSADTSTDTGSDTSTDTGSDTDNSGEGPTSTNIQGTWAMLEVQTAVVNVIGTTMEQFSHNYFLVTVTEDKISAKLCDWVTADDTKIYETVMPQSLMDILAPLDRSYTVAEDFSFTTNVGARTMGINLADPFEDVMPTDKADSRLIDQDNDGEPGVTLLIQGNIQGRLFNAIRHKASLSGKLLSDTHIKGLTTWTSDQLALGGEPEFIAKQEIQQVPSLDASKSHFEMFKVEANDDCAAIKAKRQSLFGR